jgi:carboxypeptidase family protein/TonB-dependent receptor-like protein
VHRVVLPLALLLAIAVNPAAAQVLRGRVTDAATNQRLRAAEVVLLDGQGRAIARAASDTTGAFELRGERPGNYSVRVALLGYTALTSDRIELRAREAVQIAVQLSTQPIPVAPVVIVARQRALGRLDEFEKRRTRSGSGYFITQKDIDKRVVMNASSLVVGVPGVTVQSGYYDRPQIMLPGNGEPCRAKLYIDGILMRESVDDVLIPAWVGAIEVYPRAAFAPVEYQSMGSSCGVVLFWTRELERGIKWSWKKIAVGAGFVVGAVLVTR